jgi:hypothetical protein
MLPDDPCVSRLVRHLKGNRKRLSLTHLAHLAGIPSGQLWRYLQLRPVRDTMRKRGWTLTTSRALDLPALEHPPYSLPYLVRNEPPHNN